MTTLDPRLDGAEAALLAAVDPGELMELTAAIAAEVRLSGSPEERRAFERAAALLAGWGYRTRLLAHDGYISLPGPASLHVDGLGPLACITHAFAAATPPGGLAAPVADVGAGEPADWARADVRGKLALADGLASPELGQRARAAGAAGLICVNDDHLHEMIMSPVWGNPTAEQLGRYPGLPAVSVRRADGARLRAALAGGPVRATVEAAVETGWRELPLLEASLSGAAEPDSFVLFAGHIDSWHYGAMDNGGANATMLHLARLFAERRQLLRRGLRLCFWSGHSHGRYAGSAWYVDNHWEELRRSCAAYVYIDSVGGRGATLLSEGYCMAETFDLGRAVVERHGGQPFLGARVGRAGDESLLGVGVPALLMTVSEQPADGPNAMAALWGGRSGGLGWWWHTPDDTLDKLDPALLARDARLYAATLLRLCAEPVLPLDVAAGAAELDDFVAGYQATLGGRFDLGPARRRSAALRKRAAAIQGAAEALRGRLAAGAAPPAGPAALNAALLELCRATIPLNYTAAGPFGHDPALGVPPLPLLAPADALAAAQPGSDAARLAAVALRRGLNQVAAGLDAALAAAERALALAEQLAA
jgi:hypothetical protein